MAPPIFDSDKLYKIANVKFSTYVADLVWSEPNGPIVGYLNSPSDNQVWRITNVGPNEVQIQNPNSKSYASVCTELRGVPLCAKSVARQWTLITVNPGVYRIATADEAYVWVLEKETDFFPIWIKDAAEYKGKEEALWKIIPA